MKKVFTLLSLIVLAGSCFAQFANYYVYEFMKGSTNTLGSPTLTSDGHGGNADKAPLNADLLSVGGYDFKGNKNCYIYWYQRVNGEWKFLSKQAYQMALDPTITAVRVIGTDKSVPYENFDDYNGSFKSISIYDVRLRQKQVLKANKESLSFKGKRNATFSTEITIDYASLAKPVSVRYTGVTGSVTTVGETKEIGSQTITISGTITETTTGSIELWDGWRTVYLTIPITITCERKEQTTSGSISTVRPTLYVNDTVKIGDGTSPVGLPVTYTIVSGAEKGTIIGNMLTANAPGNITVRESNDGNDTYLPYSKDLYFFFYYPNAITLSQDTITLAVGDSTCIAASVNDGTVRFFLEEKDYHILEATMGTIAFQCKYFSTDTYVTGVSEGIVALRTIGIDNGEYYPRAEETTQYVRVVAKQSNEEPNDDVDITPSSNTVEITWSATEGAASYILVIYADENHTEEVCSLTFDAQGQPISSNSPHKKPALSYDSATQEFSFTITGLDSGKTYSYLLDSYDEDNNVLESKSGQFTTTIVSSLDNLSTDTPALIDKVLEKGTIYILHNGRKYTLDGRVVE